MENSKLYIAIEQNKNNKIPPRIIHLSPKTLSFQDKININKIKDKCNDNQNIPRIECYYSEKRAIEMAKLKNDDNRNKYFDIYSPILNSNHEYKYFSYDDLLNQHLINKKDLLNKECWFTENMAFEYIGTICNDKYVNKEYNYHDFYNEAGAIEASFTKNELKRKNIIYLFNSSTDKERVIFPNKIHYGNRLKRKPRKSSFWYPTAEGCMVAYLADYIRKNNLLDQEDYYAITNIELSKLYINKDCKNRIERYLNNLSFFINIKAVPDYQIFDKDSIGYGWELYRNNYSCEENVEPDTIRQVNRYDFMEYVTYIDDMNDLTMKLNKEASKYNSNVRHGIFYKRGEKYNGRY